MTPIQAFFSPATATENHITHPAANDQGATNDDGVGDFSAESVGTEAAKASDEPHRAEADQQIPDSEGDEATAAQDMLVDKDLPEDDRVGSVPPHDPVAVVVENWTGISGSIRSAVSQPEPEEEAPIAGQKPPLILATNRPTDPISAAKPSIATIAEPVSQMTSFAEIPQIPSQVEMPLLPSSSPAATEMAPPASSRMQPPAIVQQVAEAMVRMKGEWIEIVLTPEELGKMRLVIGRQNGAPHIHIWADRPEVLDLVRRHTDLLTEQFGQDDMGSPSFSFGAADSERQDPALPAAESVEADIAEPAVLAVQVTGFKNLSGDRRIDIRL